MIDYHSSVIRYERIMGIEESVAVNTRVPVNDAIVARVLRLKSKKKTKNSYYGSSADDATAAIQLRL